MQRSYLAKSGIDRVEDMLGSSYVHSRSKQWHFRYIPVASLFVNDKDLLAFITQSNSEVERKVPFVLHKLNAAFSMEGSFCTLTFLLHSAWSFEATRRSLSRSFRYISPIPESVCSQFFAQSPKKCPRVIARSWERTPSNRSFTSK